MRGIAWVGIVLIVAGIVVLAIRTFSYTTKEKVLDVGPIHATADEEHNVFIPPIAGIAAIIVGGGLVLIGRRRT